MVIFPQKSQVCPGGNDRLETGKLVFMKVPACTLAGKRISKKLMRWTETSAFGLASFFSIPEKPLSSDNSGFRFEKIFIKILSSTR